MADATEQSDFDRLAAEFRKSPGTTEFMADAVQDGIELEDFRATPAGRILIGRAVKSAHAALEVILNPNSDQASLSNAVAEMRVQHRVLNAIADAIQSGRNTERQMKFEDQPFTDTEETES